MSWLISISENEFYLNSCMKFSRYMLRTISFYHSRWAWVDSNHRPHAYQACALTGWAISPFLIWQPPAFPYRHQYSIIGRFRLNHRVRDVDGCFPKAHRHQNMRIKFCGTKFTNLCGKLAFLSGFVNFCISGTPATERTCSRGFAKRSCLITGQWIISTWFP